MSEVDQHPQEEQEEQELKFYKSAIDWRRNLVLQMLSEGHNQAYIARTLKLHPSTISIDVQYLRVEARRHMNTFITERLPMAVTKSCNALDNITTAAWHLARNTNDDSIRIKALNLIKDTEHEKLEIVSNVNIVDQIITQTEQRQQAQPVCSSNDEHIEEPNIEVCSNEQRLTEETSVCSNEQKLDEEESAPATRARAIPIDGEDI